jgi:hippocalcin-like protein 1
MGCFGSKFKLPQRDLQFLVENTEFTRQQIEVWYAGFIVDCPSGELSKAKFIEVYQQLFPQGNAQKFCSHIFRTFDTDNSGKIDFKLVLVFFFFYLNSFLIA